MCAWGPKAFIRHMDKCSGTQETGKCSTFFDLLLCIFCSNRVKPVLWLFTHNNETQSSGLSLFLTSLCSQRNKFMLAAFSLPPAEPDVSGVVV